MKLRIELSPLHALSQEFGVKKDAKTIFYLENKSVPKKPDKIEYLMEERQNKENENPEELKKEKRSGVKMGVSAFNLGKDIPERKLSISEVSTNWSVHSSEAYVIDSSLKSADERFTYDLQESIPSKLASKWADMSWEDERVLKKIRLKKDKYGSFGLEIVEGTNGGLYIENILKGKGQDEIEVAEKGDQLLAVNGICLLNLKYSEALNVLKTTGNQIEVLVSRSCRKEIEQIPVEHEYLKSIRYETATEAENLESGNSLAKGLLSIEV